MTSKSDNAAAQAAQVPVRKRRVPLWLWVAGPLAVAGFFGWQWLYAGREVDTDNAYVKAERILVAPQVGGFEPNALDRHPSRWLHWIPTPPDDGARDATDPP